MLVLRLRHLRTTALNAACGLRVANLVSLLSDKPKGFVQKKKEKKGKTQIGPCCQIKQCRLYVKTASALAALKLRQE